jgi:hypothetical protein
MRAKDVDRTTEVMPLTILPVASPALSFELSGPFELPSKPHEHRFGLQMNTPKLFYSLLDMIF